MDTLLLLEPAIKIFHLLLGVVLVGSILLQPGKNAGIGAAFGVGGSESLFGAQGGTSFLRKLTIATAVLFLFTSVSLALVANRKSGTSGTPSVLDDVKSPVPPVVTPPPPEATKTPLEATPSGGEELAPAAAPQTTTPPTTATPKQ